jgi:hypothetical protein
MEFRFVPLDETNKAKRKVVKNMIRNAKNEPKYALTTDASVDYDAFLRHLIDLNDRLYTFQVDMNPQGRGDYGRPNPGGISPLLTLLLNETKKLDTSDYPSKNVSDIQEQLDGLNDRFDRLMANTKQSLLMNTLNLDSRLFTNKILKGLNELIDLLELKLSKPVSGGFLTSVHIR